MTTVDKLGGAGTVHPMAANTPIRPVNKYNIAWRVALVESAANHAVAEAKRAHERLDRQPPRGEKGETGPAGLSIKGDAGRDGKDGKDGNDGAPGPDSAAVLASTRAELANVLAKFEDLKLVVNAIHAQNKQAAGYIEYLRAKRSNRQ